MKFIQKLRAFYRSWKLIRLIDPKKLEEINDILENIYPGIRNEIQKLVERYDIHAISKTLQYINTHGGPQKMADYYNVADKNGKDAMLSAFNKAFKPGAPFEDAVLTLDGIAKQKRLGLYTQLIGDVKDTRSPDSHPSASRKSRHRRNHGGMTSTPITRRLSIAPACPWRQR